MSDVFAPSYGPRPGAGDSPFLQGTVEAWNATAGTNLVRVRGRTLENLQSVIGPESGLMRPGDSVVVARLNNTYAVLGRLEPPGVKPRAFGIESAAEPSAVASTSGTYGDLPGSPGPAVSVYIGSSRRALVFTSAQIQVNNASGNMAFEVTGASTITTSATAVVPVTALSADDFAGSLMTISTLTAADGLNEGVNLFTAKYRRPTGASASFGDRRLLIMPF